MKFTKQQTFFRKALMGALCCCLPVLASAACNEPSFNLTIPSGDTATKEEMEAVQQALTKFVSDGESFIACVEKEESRNQAERMRNGMLDKMESLAAQFNRQLRMFRKNNS